MMSFALSSVMSVFVSVFGLLVSWLPSSPFDMEYLQTLVSNDYVSFALGVVAWLLPISQLAGILAAWVAALALYNIGVILYSNFKRVG